MEIKVLNYTDIIDNEIINFLMRYVSNNINNEKENSSINLIDVANEMVKKHNLSSDSANRIITPMKRIQNFYDSVYKEIKISQELIDKYFGPFISDEETIASVFKFVLSNFEYKHGYLNDSAVYSTLIDLLINNKDVIVDTEEEIINDYNTFISRLEKNDVSDKVKWQCVQVALNYKKYFDEINLIIEEVSKIYNSKIFMIEDIINESKNELQKIISSINTDQLIDYFHIGFNDIENSSIAIKTSYVNSVGMIKLNGKTTLTIGILYQLLNKELESESFDSSYSTIKNLGDKRKLEIIMALKQSPCNGIELAEKLGITPATISFHMKQLLNSGMVGAQFGEKNKYSIRSKKIIKDIDVFINMFEN